MKLWYDKPARFWHEALPIGNGRMGGMVHGGITRELIQLNEDSVWSGKHLNRINPDAKENLPVIRKLIREGRVEEAQRSQVCPIPSVPIRRRANVICRCTMGMRYRIIGESWSLRRAFPA